MEKNSFTIIELLVVIAIIAIIAVIVFPNYKSGQSQLALERAANKLAQDIRSMQQKAMSAEKDDRCSPHNHKGGWGVFFDKNEIKQYIIFSDCNDNNNYDLGNDKTVDVEFENGVKIDSLPANFMSVIFTPPDPTITINPSSLSKGEVRITLENNNSKIKIITINKAGLINVSD